MIALARDFAVYAAGRAIPSIGSMVFTLVCVQLLPPAEYAHYSFYILPALVAATFAGGLAGQPLLRFGLQLEASSRRLALLGLPLGGAALAIPVIAAWNVWKGGAPFDTVAALPLVPLIAVTDARRSFLVASSRPAGVFRLDTLRSCLSLAALLVAWAVITRVAPPPTALAPIVAMSLGTLGALLLVRASPANAAPTCAVRVDRAYLAYGIWTAGWLALTTLFPLLERVLVEGARGIETAGVYSAISDPLLAVLSAGTSVVGSALWPRFIDAWNGGDEALFRKVGRMGLLGTVAAGSVVAIACLLVAWFSPGRLAALLASNPLLVAAMVAVTTLWQAAVFVHKPLELMNATRTIFGCLLLSLVLFVALARNLVGPFGGVGVLAAKGAAGVLYCGGSALMARRKRHRGE
jgi:hypothetical protein